MKENISKLKSPWGINGYYLLIAALLCLLYILLLQPVSNRGDAGDYITLAKQLIGTDTSRKDLSNRSPFYSVILAVFIKIFGEDFFIEFVFYFQYLLIFLCCVLLYKIFSEIISSPYVTALTGIVFLLNISTIHFGFMILSETLTLFFFVFTAYTAVKYVSTGHKRRSLFILGLSTGLLILTRYNMLLLPFVLLFFIFVFHIGESGWKKMKVLAIRILFFLLPLLFVLNTWCYRNYRTYGFYFLFPPSYGSQRFVEPSLVSENTQVSPGRRQVLDIFLRAKKKVLSKSPPLKKGSLLKFIPIRELLYEMKAGYLIYRAAHPDLIRYFGLEQAQRPEFSLAEKLRPFFAEVAKQNKFKLFLVRMYSLANSFRASASSLPGGDDLNLNILPGFIFVVYKILFLALMMLFLVLSFVYTIHVIKNKLIKENYKQFFLLGLIIYFPVVNFLAATYSDANRFKYPSDPLVFGMLAYYTYYFYKLRREKNLTVKPGNQGRNAPGKIEEK